VILDPSGNRRFFGVYRGTVTNSKDPQNKRRIKATVPQVLGTEPTDWAWPTDSSSTYSTPPKIGQGVWVMFEGGDPSFPVWSGTFGDYKGNGTQVELTDLPKASYPETISDNVSAEKFDVISSVVDIASGLESISGGLEGQILAKLSDDNYDTTWIDNYAGELRIIVKNDSGVTINKGQAVMAVGSVGDRIRVAKANADGSISARFMLGVASEDITNGNEGYINLLGEIKQLNTSAFTVGTVLFINPTTPGALTSTEPVSPQLDMSVAIVTRQHATTGIIFVRMWNQGVDLGEVNDVKITGTIADNEVLAYDTTSSVWINQTASEAGLAPIASPTFTGTVSGITKSMVGLGNVDNTSDANKPVSTAQQTALNLKANLAGPTFTGTVSGITKSMVGLSNVDNTSDANKPISSATQTALDQRPISHNYVLNSAFDIWQRGTSFTYGVQQYCADRWKVGRGGHVAGGTSNRSTTVPVDFNYSTFLQRDSGNTSTQPLRLTQPFESAGKNLRGKTVTLSFYARAGSGYSPTDKLLRFGLHFASVAPESVAYATGGLFLSSNAGYATADDDVAVTTSWVRYSGTFTVPTNADAMLIYFSHNPVGTSDGQDFVRITGVQLEEGSVATPFKKNSGNIQSELAACQRFFYQSPLPAPTIDYDYQADPNGFGATDYVSLPVTMRATPSIGLTFTNFDNASNGGTIGIKPSGFTTRAFRANGSFAYFRYGITFSATAEL
jgi:hypothetical protein